METVWLSVLLLASIATCQFLDLDIPKGDAIVKLNEQNFETTITRTRHILVKFISSDCQHCETMGLEYAKAADVLADEQSAIKIAVFNVEKDRPLAKKYGIETIPTIKFFRDGQPIDYTEGDLGVNIIQWLDRYAEVAKTLKEVDDVEDFTDKYDVTVVGFFSDMASDSAKSFLKVADEMQKFSPFGATTFEELRIEYDVEEEGVVVFRKADKGRSYLTQNFSPENIKDHIIHNALPLITEFNAQNSKRVFDSSITSHILLFISEKSQGFQETLEMYKKLAEEFKRKVLFLRVNTDDLKHQVTMSYFHLSRSDIPAVRFVKDNSAKYVPETTELTEGSIRKFINDALSGNLKLYTRSENIPSDWNAKPVKVLVGKNFQDVVFDKTKGVFVYFYSADCVICNKKVNKMWDELAEHFQSIADLVLVKIDAKANDIEGVELSIIPCFKFFPKNNDKGIDYKGRVTQDALSDFLNENGHALPVKTEL